MQAPKSGNRPHFISATAIMLLCASLWPPLALGALTATLDRFQISMGETARLVLSSDGEEDPADADLAGLQAHFDILQRSSSMSTQIINGQREQRRELVMEITPRAEGTVTIPPFVVGTQRSTPITVSVSAEPQLSAGDEVVLFDAEVDRDAVYVQGQVLLTLRVQQAVNLDSRSVSELEIEDAVVKTLGQNSFQRTIDGRPWLVHEIRVAIFPQASGELRIPPQTFSGRLSSGRRSLFDMRSSGRLVRRSTEELRVTVKPRPASYTEPQWLPAADIDVEEQWSGSVEQLRVGDSITRSITVTAKGLQGAQLPPLSMTLPEGLRVYPDQPTINELDGADGVTGIRTDSLALVAVRAGEYTIPPLTVRWWDTQADRLREETLPGRRLRVLPAAVPAGVSTSADEVTVAVGAAPTGSTDAGLWPWLAVLCALGWAATALLAWRRRAPAAASETRSAPSRRELLAACAANDAALAWQRLRDWLLAAGHRGTVDAWRQAQNDPALDAALRDLEEQLYGSAKTLTWSGAALASALRALPEPRFGDRAAAAGDLPRLYPAAS